MSVLQDVFENKATREEREKILRFVSQNETLKNAITSLLAKNPTLATNFGNFINKRTNAILESLQSEAITHRMFKDLDSAYGKELKHRYGKVEYDMKRALEGVNFKDTGLKIHAILDDLSAQIPHVTNSHQTITAMQEKLNMRGGNLTISDILDIRKYYNDILRSKEWKNASYKHVQAINAHIDSSVQESLESVSNLSGIHTKKLWDNYADINKEYADYAKFKDSSFYKQSIKSQRKEKEPTNEEFTKAILKQAQRSEGFNNKVFERIAKNTSPTLQAQAIRELITKNLANPNGEYKAIKWQQLIEDLEKIEHSISDTRLQDFIGNLRLAKKLYAHDKEFLDSITHALGSKPASVLISAANGLFGRALLLFYNFVHKILSRYTGVVSEKMVHENLEYQLSQALRYARDTKDFIHVSIESIQRNLPKEDKEAQRILQEFEYWKERLNTPSANAFYTMKEAKEIQDSLANNEIITLEYNIASQAYEPHIQSLQNNLSTIQNHIAANPKTKESMSLIPLQKAYNEALQKSEALKQALQSSQALPSKISPQDFTLQDYHTEVVQIANELLGDSIYEKAFVKTKEYDNTQGLTKSYPILLAQEQRGIHPNSLSTLAQTIDKIESKQLQQEHKLLNTIQKTLKDLIVMPIILVDSKGNAMPLTTQAIKNFILQSIKDELDHIATRHTLVKPEVNMIPLQSKLKALTYDIHKESMQTLRDMQTKASDFIESVENIELKQIEYKKQNDTQNTEQPEITTSETALSKSIAKLKQEINTDDLSAEQREIYDVFVGNKDKIILQGKDLNDLYSLQSGSRRGGAKKILIKHAGLEKTGGLSNDEIVNLMQVVRKGSIDDNSFTLHDDFIRYAYDLKENDVNLRLVVDEYNDDKKIFDYYSDRNFIDYKNPKTSQEIQSNIPRKSKKEQVEKQDFEEFIEYDIDRNMPSNAHTDLGKEYEAYNTLLKEYKEAEQSNIPYKRILEVKYQDIHKAAQDLQHIDITHLKPQEQQSYKNALNEIQQSLSYLEDMATLAKTMPQIYEPIMQGYNTLRLEALRNDMNTLIDSFKIPFKPIHTNMNPSLPLLSYNKTMPLLEYKPQFNTDILHNMLNTPFAKEIFSTIKAQEALYKEIQDLESKADKLKPKAKARLTQRAKIKRQEAQAKQDYLQTLLKSKEPFMYEREKELFIQDSKQNLNQVTSKEIDNGKYSNGNNNNFDTRSSNNDSQKMGTNRDFGRGNNGDESTEMGRLRAGEEKQAGDSEATKREVGARDTATKTRATKTHDTQRGEIDNLSTKDTIKQREKAISDVLFKEFENQYTQDSIIDKFIQKKARWQTTEGYYKTPRVFKENKKYIEATKENVLNSKYFKAFERKEQKDFLAQKEQKLQEAQKEAKRIATLQEAIKDITKDKPYSEIKKSLLDIVGDLIVDIEQTLHMKPLSEFGMNYPQHYRDGQGAITRLLIEAKDYEARKEAGKLTEAEIEQGAYKGQVAGAFYKEGLGDIDLVWGNENLGLQKIITKHLSKGDFKAWGEGKMESYSLKTM